ncbi:MAG: peptidoglycan-binding protein [Pseudonocardia sp.]
MSGDDVARLQQALVDRGYLRSAVDGRFGPLTDNAVRSFQADHGLSVDGVAGPGTQAALGLAEPVAGGQSTGDASGPSAVARSLHIGVNRVDPARYGGWDGALSGCENDARTMTSIAQAEGFRTAQLFTADATSANVLAEIAEAARTLTTGGIFLLSYAGHGGQRPNTGADPEEDQQDETWVLYDRQLLDDELELAFTAFAPGVSIVLLSDSCHSGTVYRGMDSAQLAVAELKDSYYVGLASPRPGPDDVGTAATFPRPPAGERTGEPVAVQRALFARATGWELGDHGFRSAGTRVPSRFPGQHSRAAVGLLTRTGVAAVPGSGSPDAGRVVTRNMPLGTNAIVNELQAEVLAAVGDAAAARGAIRASGLLISGCQDNQLSQEVNGAGVFTTAVERTWAGNTFAGSYTAFHQEILTRMGPTQTPQLSLFGAQPDALAARTPFDP